MTANNTPAVPEPDPTRIQLDALAYRLGRDAWYARVTTRPDRTLCLHVINTANLDDERLVLIEDQPLGRWYRFHDGVFIAPVNDSDQAALQIFQLMAAPSS